MENAMLRNRLQRMEKQHQKEFEDQRKDFEIRRALKESRIKQLERQMESHQDAQEIILIQQEDLDAAKAELQQSKKDCADKTALIDGHLARNLKLEGVVRQLIAEKIDLEKRIETVQPLVLIGAAIRRKVYRKGS